MRYFEYMPKACLQDLTINATHGIELIDAIIDIRGLMDSAKMRNDYNELLDLQIECNDQSKFLLNHIDYLIKEISQLREDYSRNIEAEIN